MDKETKIKLEKLQAEKNNGFESYLNYITQHFGKEGMISYYKAKKYFYYQNTESDSLDNLFLEIKYEIYNHIILSFIDECENKIEILTKTYFGNLNLYNGYRID